MTATWAGCCQASVMYPDHRIAARTEPSNPAARSTGSWQLQCSAIAALTCTPGPFCRSKCSSGEYSPEAELSCQPCRHGWLSTVGQGEGQPSAPATGLQFAIRILPSLQVDVSTCAPLAKMHLSSGAVGYQPGRKKGP